MQNENPISWADFQKIEMRIGTILTAQEFEEARNPAYKLTIDFGPYGIKKTSAQITQQYSVDELVGKQIIAVINFPKKQIATMQSECLVLGCLGDEKTVTLLQPEKTVENGQRIG